MNLYAQIYVLVLLKINITLHAFSATDHFKNTSTAIARAKMTQTEIFAVRIIGLVNNRS